MTVSCANRIWLLEMKYQVQSIAPTLVAFHTANGTSVISRGSAIATITFAMPSRTRSRYNETISISIRDIVRSQGMVGPNNPLKDLHPPDYTEGNSLMGEEKV